MAWNPTLYESRHAFVWEYGRALLSLVAPRPGERILDVGCGTGRLTAELAAAGAGVLGIDNSPAMISQARANFPDLEFQLIDVTSLPFQAEFDAVFSNAALHWVRDPEAAAASMARALRTGGRLAAEFGGRGNVRVILDAICATLEALGVARPRDLNPWYYPSVAEYSGILERHGLAVLQAALFDRPTPLEGGERGLADWLEMFAQPFTEPLNAAQRGEFTRRVGELAAPRLFKDGVWTVDYRRLRVVAVKE